MGDNIAAENPDKEMLRLCSVRCPHMNEITLEDTLAALEQDRSPHRGGAEEIHLRRRRDAIERMFSVVLMQTDVLIVGSGIGGVTAALELADRLRSEQITRADARRRGRRFATRARPRAGSSLAASRRLRRST